MAKVNVPNMVEKGHGHERQTETVALSLSLSLFSHVTFHAHEQEWARHLA